MYPLHCSASVAWYSLVPSPSPPSPLTPRMEEEDAAPTYNGISLGPKKERGLTVVTMRTGLEGAELSETAWTEKDKQTPCDFTDKWNPKIKIREPTRQKRTHRHTELTLSCVFSGRAVSTCRWDSSARPLWEGGRSLPLLRLTCQERGALSPLL